MAPLWPEAVRSRLAELIDDGLAVFLGGTDTGKSTLIQELHEMIGGEVVDGDLGQSRIGPPSCISRGDYERTLESYFVGDISPRGNLLPTVVGLKLMTDHARRPCLVDTDGYIGEPAALAYKTELINLLKPDVLVLLQRAGELEYFRLYSRKRVKVVTVRVNHQGLKSREERIRAREEAFRTYFAKAELRRWPLQELRFERVPFGHGEPIENPELEKLLDCTVLGAWRHGPRATLLLEGRPAPGSLTELKQALGLEFIDLVSGAALQDRLVGCLLRGELQGLGIIKRVREGMVEVLTPATEATVLQLGRLRVAEDGRHLRLPPE